MARRIIQDLGLAAVLTLVAVMGTGPAAANQDLTAPGPSYVLVVVASLAVAARRWRPMWTFGVAGAATTAYLGLGYAYGPIFFALVVAVYSLAVQAPLRRAVASTAVLLAAGTVAVLVGVVEGERTWPDFASVAGWIAVPAAVGVALKARRDAATAVRAEQGRRALSEERLHLAQEVHDVVGHGLAVVAMQAGVALRVVDRDPAQARAALEAIRATSREALDGLRAELAALRGEPEWPGQPGRPESPEAPLRPAVGLSDLPRLVERLRSGGLPVAVEVDGAAESLPGDVDRAAYRIVQESLSNVLRHGGAGAAATVSIRRSPGGLRVEVTNSGRPSDGAADPHGVEGHGVEGMRSRAAALGGTLSAGRRRDGGYAVVAVLPVDAPGTGVTA
jgi:signal transduction histidine kinase